MRQQRIAILGGTSGIGLAVARACLGQGADVVVCSSGRARLDAALEALGPGASGQVADLSSESAVQALFERIGAFDHLVYTAGEPLKLLGLEADLEEMRSFFQVRYWGALAAAKYARGQIRRGGSITFTGGTAGQRPLGAGWAAASSICQAMEGLTRALAIELQPMRVNCVAPGVVKTPLWSRLSEADREAFYAAEAERLPVGHAGEVDEIALSYLYLISQTYVTGQIAYVDGGGLLA